MDAIEYWTDKVRSDETWMQIEAADLIARMSADGEVTLDAFDACAVLRRLQQGHGLTEACTGCTERERTAAVRLISRLIGLALALDTEVQKEAERRAEAHAERWSAEAAA
jgi:hypothetical protein